MSEVSPFAFWVDGVLLTVISTTGLVGSIMSIVVLLKPRIRDFFSSFLTALAIFDSLFLLLAILEIGGTNMSTWFGNYVSTHYIPYTHGLLGIARTGSVYVTMSVTLERYFAIVHPLKHFKVKKYLLPTTILFSVLYNMPKFFELETYIFPYINETSIRKTALRKNPLYDHLYTFWSKVIVLEFIPYMTIIILNAFIVTKIYESLKFRGRFDRTALAEGQDRQRNGAEAEKALSGSEFPHQPPTFRPRARSVVEDIGLAQKEERPHKRPSGLILEVPSHRMAARRLSTGMVNTDNHQSTSNIVVQQQVRFSSTKANNLVNRRVMPTKQGSFQEREINLAITLVLISLLFVFCQSFKLIPDIYEAIYCNHDLTKPIGHCQTTNFIETIISLSNLLVCVNSSGNFLFYMLRGKKFRDAFYQTYVRLLCRCCKKTPRSGDSSQVSLSLASHQLCSVRKMNQATNSSLPLPSTVHPTPKASTGINCRVGFRNLNVLRQESVSNFMECDTTISIQVDDEGRS